MKSTGRFLAVALLCGFRTGSVQALHIYPLGLSDSRIEIERRRVELSDVDGFADKLPIVPGMTILDLGAGTGQYAFLFAERMKGSGRVFATECSSDLVEYMSREARRRQLRNLSSVLVRCDQVDEFYRQHIFDAIFVSHVYIFIEERVEQMRVLRGSLSDRGRLVIVQSNGVPQYFEAVRDPGGLVRALAALPQGDYVRLLLSSSTQAWLQDPRVDARAATASVIRDFNAEAAGLAVLGPLIKPGPLPPWALSDGKDRRYAQLILDHARLRSAARGRASGGLTDASIRLVGSRIVHMILEDRLPGQLSVSENHALQRLKSELAEAGFQFQGFIPNFLPTEFAAVFVKAAP